VQVAYPAARTHVADTCNDALHRPDAGFSFYRSSSESDPSDPSAYEHEYQHGNGVHNNDPVDEANFNGVRSVREPEGGSALLVSHSKRPEARHAQFCWHPFPSGCCKAYWTIPPGGSNTLERRPHPPAVGGTRAGRPAGKKKKTTRAEQVVACKSGT
jgi:hypothetical protein